MPRTWHPSEEEETFTAAGNDAIAYEDEPWHAKWKNLPVYSEDKEVIQYIVKEIPELSGYTVSYSGTDDPTFVTTGGIITNKLNETNVKIVKVRADNINETLTGAEFTLKRQTGTDKNGNPILEVFGSYNKIPVDNDGEILFENLIDGDYQLFEETPPAGFNRLTTPVTFKVKNGAVDDTDGNSADGNTIRYIPKDETNPATFKISNTAGVELPATGGSGTLPYTLGGLALVLLAGVLLMSRKRKIRE